MLKVQQFINNILILKDYIIDIFVEICSLWGILTLIPSLLGIFFRMFPLQQLLTEQLKLVSGVISSDVFLFISIIIVFQVSNFKVYKKKVTEFEKVNNEFSFYEVELKEIVRIGGPIDNKRLKLRKIIDENINLGGINLSSLAPLTNPLIKEYNEKVQLYNSELSEIQNILKKGLYSIRVEALIKNKYDENINISIDILSPNSHFLKKLELPTAPIYGNRDYFTHILKHTLNYDFDIEKSFSDDNKIIYFEIKGGQNADTAIHLPRQRHEHLLICSPEKKVTLQVEISSKNSRKKIFPLSFNTEDGIKSIDVLSIS